jgi:hypothetical protein
MSELAYLPNRATHLRPDEPNLAIHPFKDELYITRSIPEAPDTPVGLDIRRLDHALEYAEWVRQEEVIPPKNEEDVFALLEREFRAAKFLDGTHENVLEHSLHLQALVLDEAENRPDISPYDADMYPMVHDWGEAIGKDTVITDPASEATRFWRGAANDTILFAFIALSNPYMRKYADYRFSEMFGLWTPPTALTNSMDKAAAYDFQLGDNVQATLHRERQESFDHILSVLMPKLVKDVSVLRKGMDTMYNLGSKWESWDCKPLEGDLETMIKFHAYHAWAAHQAKQQNADPGSNSAEIIRYFQDAFQSEAGFERAPAQRILRTEEQLNEAKRFGEVVLLHGNRGGFRPFPTGPSGQRLLLPDNVVQLAS